MLPAAHLTFGLRARRLGLRLPGSIAALVVIHALLDSPTPSRCLSSCSWSLLACWLRRSPRFAPLADHLVFQLWPSHPLLYLALAQVLSTHPAPKLLNGYGFSLQSSLRRCPVQGASLSFVFLAFHGARRPHANTRHRTFDNRCPLHLRQPTIASSLRRCSGACDFGALQWCFGCDCFGGFFFAFVEALSDTAFLAQACISAATRAPVRPNTGCDCFARGKRVLPHAHKQ